MKILGINIDNPIKENVTIYKCPYCNKKFLNKNSIYGHIVKKYCQNFYIDFAIKTNEYNEEKITIQEYYEWCYEKGYIEFLKITDEEKQKLSDDLVEKITSMYCDDYEDI